MSMNTLSPLDEVDAARAQEYALLATLLLQPPDADLLARLAKLPGDTSPLGAAHAALATAARSSKAENVEREFMDLFVGLGRGELLPYGSYYLSGFLHERPLARLRRDLTQFGIERAAGATELEDHIGLLCEIMAGVVDKTIPAPSNAAQAIFEAHMRPWAKRFFKDLEGAKTARFYRSVGTLGRTFMDIEAEAFTLSA